MKEKITTAPNLRFRKDYNFVTIYNFDTDDLFKAPLIAKNVLNHCDGTHTNEEIVECLVKDGILRNNEKDKQKMSEYIDDLIKKGILVYV